MEIIKKILNIFKRKKPKILIHLDRDCLVQIFYNGNVDIEITNYKDSIFYIDDGHKIDEKSDQFMDNFKHNLCLLNKGNEIHKELNQ